MSQNYYITDVFTNKVFSGAQIAVFPDADNLSDEMMTAIAKKMNLSETVFVSKQGKNEYERTMRVFSPLGEIEFSGHPVIATGFVLLESGAVKPTGTNTKLSLQQKKGAVEVNVTTSEQGKAEFVQFSSKVSSVIDRFTPLDGELADFLSITPAELDHKKYSTRLVSCGFPYLIVPVWNYESVRNARFNLAAWSQSAAPQTAAQEILLFSPKTPFQDANFNARLLGPNIGLREDPPVGTAMPAFASYLCSFDFTQQGTHTFAVDRGDEERRRSVINIEMDNKPGTELALRIGGEAVIVAQGQMYL